MLEAVLQRIPEVNAAMFQQLCRLLYIISRSSQLNRMDASNLAKVIGPNILGSKDTTDYLQGINAINDVLTCAIEHYPELFEQGVAWENRWNDALEESASHPVRTPTTEWSWSSVTDTRTLSFALALVCRSAMQSCTASCKDTSSPSRACALLSATRACGPETRRVSSVSGTPKPINW